MESGHAAAELERLLAHSGWLTALARQLVRDPASADDLVQDTWHAALRSPTRPVSSDRGWLATLLSNVARARARSESARRVRERAVAEPEAIEGPDELVERAEAQRNLLERVLELDEPYKSIVLARYSQGLTSAEIARRTGANESSIRTRLARAHQQLRERIERKGRGLAGLAPLWNAASSHAPSIQRGGTAAFSGSVGKGVCVMGLLLKGVAVATVALCGWLIWRGVDHHTEGLALSPRTEHEKPESLDETKEVTTARVPLQPPEKVASPAKVTAATAKRPKDPDAVDTTKLELTFLRDQVPAAGVRVWIAPHDKWPIQYCLDVKARPPKEALTADTGSLGSARFTGLDPLSWKFRVGFATAPGLDHPDSFITTDVFPGYPHTVLIGTASVSGRVFDAVGRLRPGVGVEVYRAKADSEHTYIATHTIVDERGEYRVADLPEGSYFVIMESDGHFDGHGEVERHSVELLAGQTKTVDFGNPISSPKWTGRVVNALHEPYKGIRLQIDNAKDGYEAGCAIDSDGRFELAFVPGMVSVHVFVEGCPGEGFLFESQELPARDFERDLVVPGARLRVHVAGLSDESGSKDPRAAQNATRLSVRPKGQDHPGAFRSTTQTEVGIFVIDGLQPGTWTVSVWPGAFTEGSTVDVSIGPEQSVADLSLHIRKQ